MFFLWRLYGYKGHEVVMGWEDGKSFGAKLVRIIEKIDSLHTEGRKVFLVGVSAGGSAVLNAYAARKDSVSGVASVAGWLRDIPEVHETLVNTRSRSPAFVESVTILEENNLPNFSEADRSKIITLRPLADAVVPPHIARLEGVRDVQIPIRGHLPACGLIPTVFSKRFFKFFNMK
jgi:pimeloyl-ACP methyl ester carboxylesterase